MIAITGASGQLGRLVIEQLLKQIPASTIVAIVRDPAKASDLQATGVLLRKADYNLPETLALAFAGVNRLLFISSSEVGRRAAQHRAVVDAAKQAGVELIAYTSLLHADKSPLPLAAEHRETEAMLRSSGVSHVLLRNGWYLENYLDVIALAVEQGVITGCAGEGRISAAARGDFAQAAVAVMTREGQSGHVYELAGDDAFTLEELAAEIMRQSGKSVTYQNLSQEDHQVTLQQAGMSALLATVLSESDAAIAKGGLFDDSRQLSQLIGRPTMPLAVLVKAALER